MTGSVSELTFHDGALRDLLEGDPVEVAPRLLGSVLVASAEGRNGTAGWVGGRIVEVEAYRGADDTASHAFRGETARNRVMFGRPGLLYVYFSYGIHHCCNIVCRPEGTAGAVLVRALEPLFGLELMRGRRSQLSGLRERDLCSGPGKLCQALGIGRSDDGADLLADGSRIRLGCLPAGTTDPAILQGSRIGLSSLLPAAAEPWRWWWAGNAHVSKGAGAGDQAP